MPTILAIETSTELASVALLRAGMTLTTRESRGAQTHSMTVLGLVQELLAEAGITLIRLVMQLHLDRALAHSQVHEPLVA
jgi:tRNA A37 threonylcarbamoyladenosine modification protein TsaB